MGAGKEHVYPITSRNTSSFFSGDKDTFWVGSAAYQQGYYVVERPLEIIAAKRMNGTFWKEPQSIFNGAMGQFNPLNNSEIFTMHVCLPLLSFYCSSPNLKAHPT